MKNIVKFLLIYCLVLLPILGFGQAPKFFNFQAVLTNPVGAFDTEVTIDVAIKNSLEATTVLFSEQHQVTIGSAGLLSLTIGSIENLGVVDWTTMPLYLEITVNNELMGVSEIVTVPYAMHADIAGSVPSLDYTISDNTPDFSLVDPDPADDFSGSYSDLSNLPTVITSADFTKASLFTASNPIDLETLQSDVTANSLKISFPGFGTTLGTAFSQKWSKVGSNLYHTTGNAGINTVSSSNSTIALDIGGAMKVDMIDLAATPGLLFLEASSGFFKYYNELGVTNELIPATAAEFATGYDNVNDVNIRGKVKVGSTESTLEASLVLSSSTPVIRFVDTSSSSAFPTNDWELTANDQMINGDNYFGIVDVDTDTNPFRVTAGVTDNALFISSSGDIKLKGTTPTAKLDADGETIKGTLFIGDGSQLTGLVGAGSSSVTNTGSTTIGADNDGDNNGSILFETASSTRLTLSDLGHVGVGTAPTSNELLSVSGASVASPVSIDPVLVNGAVDANGKRIIVFQTNPGGFPSLIGAIGQEVIIINKSATTLSLSYGTGLASLGQYASITLLNTSVGWVVKYRSI